MRHIVPFNRVLPGPPRDPGGGLRKRGGARVEPVAELAGWVHPPPTAPQELSYPHPGSGPWISWPGLVGKLRLYRAAMGWDLL